ncbi:MAG TPA: cation diffusion facilitator family transporter [Anaerolineales bacterium]|nr:cation diffusion facilitator family transporter [Anaerolineales bacterium]
MPHQQAEHNDLMKNRASLTRFAWLSIGAAVATITLKAVAYVLTGSVGLLSDAIESLVNLAAASMALSMLIIAARPADESHVYGHSKAEYFASITEGLLILGAATAITNAALDRLLHPRPLEQLGLGLAVSISASTINFLVARKLMSEGKKRNSITLEADAQHLMTDVWTSAGVIGGVGVAGITGWNWLDPLVAIAVALNIIWTGIQLVRRSVAGLMDAALPEQEQTLIQEVMEKYHERGVSFHALRTRQAAARRFISVHILVPGDWTVHDAHHIAEDFETDIRNVLGGVVTVFTHLEPVEDELSMEDIFLDREQ